MKTLADRAKWQIETVILKKSQINYAYLIKSKERRILYIVHHILFDTSYTNISYKQIKIPLISK